MKKSLVKIALFAVVIFVLTGCTQNHQSVAKNIDKVDMNRAAWLAYWDLDAGEKDLVQLGKKEGKLSYFGAYFDEFDRLFIPPELGEIKNVHNEENRMRNVSFFVNDKKIYSFGAMVLKYIEVLNDLFLWVC